jgi:hypothetical protein
MPFNNMRPILKLLLLGMILTTGCTGQVMSKNRTPVTARTDQFIMVSVAAGDTYASLAETYLKDRNKAWQIAASNQNKPLSPGQRIIISLVPITYGGLQKNGYQTVPVLVYTELAAAPSKSKIVSARNFHQQLDYLRTNGFVPVSLDQFHAFLELKDQLPPNAVVITFDTTAAWAYGIAYPALKQRGMKAAIFISPDQVGEKGNLTWAQLAEMVAGGMDVGLYGPSIKTPAKEDAKTYLEALETKFTDPQKIFQHQLKQPCRYFAYPPGRKQRPDHRLAQEAWLSGRLYPQAGKQSFFCG